MSEPEQPIGSSGHVGESVLAGLSTEMVRLQKQYFGRGPERAKSYMVDDLLFIVLRGGVTRAEQTMLEADHENLVRNFRQQFQNEMGARLVSMVEDQTGRKVVNYQSQVVFDPDLVIEIFVFDDAAPSDEIRETAEAQLEDRPVGEIGGDEVATEDATEPER
jgi:uncharacterized protein YbcI